MLPPYPEELRRQLRGQGAATTPAAKALLKELDVVAERLAEEAAPPSTTTPVAPASGEMLQNLMTRPNRPISPRMGIGVIRCA
jgi:hypothetical protein